jgi:hypothetical protein
MTTYKNCFWGVDIRLMLSKKKLGGSDSHYAETVGLGVTLIEAEYVDRC